LKASQTSAAPRERLSRRRGDGCKIAGVAFHGRIVISLTVNLSISSSVCACRSLDLMEVVAPDLAFEVEGSDVCTATNDRLESNRMKRQSKPSRKILRQECLRNNNQLKWPPTALMCYSRVTSFFKACC